MSSKRVLVIGIIGVVIVVALFAGWRYFSGSTDTNQQAAILTETQKNSPQQPAERSLLSKLLGDTKSGESRLSKLLEPFGDQSSAPQKQFKPVDLYYTLEPGNSGSLAHFYISSVSTPVQGVQMKVTYPENVTVSSIEPAPRFPDLIVADIDSQTRTLSVMASIGFDGRSVTGAYPIFSVIYTGDTPRFTINESETIVATQGQSIPFTIDRDL